MIVKNSDCFRYALKRGMRLTALSAVAMSLSGCLVALPPAVQVASLALDGVSYITTGKSVTDHAISTVTAQDCAMMRLVKGQWICAAPEVETAMTLETAPQANAYADSVVPAERDETFQAYAASRQSAPGPDLDEIINGPRDKRANPFDSIYMETAAGPTE